VSTSAPPTTLTGVIPYLYYKDKKPEDFAPARGKAVYIDLPTDDDVAFFSFKTDEQGKLCAVPDPNARARDSMWIFAGETRSFWVFYDDKPLASIRELTHDQCGEVKLEKRQVEGRDEYFFKVKRKPKLAFPVDVGAKDAAGAAAVVSAQVFDVFIDGLSVPCGARAGADGKVTVEFRCPDGKHKIVIGMSAADAPPEKRQLIFLFANEVEVTAD